MPFFSFSVNEISPPLTKFNITANNVYFSKNTQLWKILNKKNNSIINFLRYEKRKPTYNIGKNILFCLPPSIGLGDASGSKMNLVLEILESTDFFNELYVDESFVIELSAIEAYDKDSRRKLNSVKLEK